MAAPPSIKDRSCLLVAPEKGARKLLAGILRQIGVGSVREADSIDHATVIVRYTGVDFIVWAGSGNDHLELLRIIRQELTGIAQKTPVLCVTERWDVDRLLAARDAGATGFMPLPLTMSGTLRTITAMLNDRREFINYQNYVGPDRRRATADDYAGPRRRKDDKNTSRRANAEAGGDDFGLNPLDSAWQSPAATDQTMTAQQRDRDGGNGAPRARPAGAPARDLDDGVPADWQEGGIGSAENTSPVTRTTLFRRRAEVVDEALRLIGEMDALVAAKATGGAEFTQLFGRTMNLMALIHGYTRDEPLSAGFFKAKYGEIVESIGRFSSNILSGGLERLVQQSKQRIDGTIPASLGSAQKIYDRMSQFESLIATLGGYPKLPTDMLDLVRQLWENLLLLADLDKGLDAWDGGKDTLMRERATDSLATARDILSSRPAADTQGATLERLKEKSKVSTPQ